MEFKKPQYEKLLETGQPLVDKCSSNTDTVSKALENAKRDWKGLEEKLDNGSRKADEMKKALGRLEKSIAPVDEVCSVVETALDECKPFGIDCDAGEREIERLGVCLMLSYTQKFRCFFLLLFLLDWDIKMLWCQLRKGKV